MAAGLSDGARQLRFSSVPGRWAVTRLPADSPVPDWLDLGQHSFFSLSRSADELSIVCVESAVPTHARAQRDWALLRLHGPFGFSETGVLAAIVRPLAEASIGIFVISTFDTDYVLLAAERLDQACNVLVSAGHIHADAMAGT